MSIAFWKYFILLLSHYTEKVQPLFQCQLFALFDIQIIRAGYGISKGCIFATQWKSLHLPYPFFTFWQLLPNPSISRYFLYSSIGNNHCFRCKLLNRLSRNKTQNKLTTGYINNWKIFWIIFSKTLDIHISFWYNISVKIIK